ncbi:MAG TPA: Uma2 family endonuclease [Steroidobacteraceae bacterium]|nr:Uma2 family endonuclease [Steroidobacteraceae bacterium]
MALPRRDTRHHTYADYLTWSERERDELIDGIAYVKEPPAPSRSHQELVGELHFQIRLALDGKSWRAYVAPFDVRLPKSGESDDRIDTVVQPDVLIVGDLAKLDERGMRGAPDWIAEVISPATAAYDQIVKLPIYERAAVPEVWLVHPADRTLTIYQLEGARYGRPLILELKGQTAIRAVPGVSIDWDRASPMA